MMNPDPYQTPAGLGESARVLVDRQQRSKLAETIRRFLREEITAFELDELLLEFHGSTDSAVRFVARATWYHYDDCVDHLVAFSKAEWDYFQRMLLLLESDRVVHTETERQWSWSQAIACLALLAFVLIALRTGWGYHLLAVAVPLGFVSIGVARLRRTSEAVEPDDLTIFPFTSFADLRSAHAAVGFRKTRCPRRLRPHRIRSSRLQALLNCYRYLLWLLLSPVVLAFQMLPKHVSEPRVVSA